ncbi:MAG: 50S ribosomal protein L1 [Patescibacteria group bacterium]|jgi:large subunit ribosomal protein L1|nr:50S ribosomal protein L1 [Patescibacteria group bacterium]
MKRSKRYLELAKKINSSKTYPLAEAIKLVKETGVAKFDGSVEVHAKLSIDPKKNDQQVRGAVSLPHGTGKTKKIAAFVSAEKEKEAKEAGADIVGGQELIDEIKKDGKINFDVALATPDMMPKLAVIAKILGPRGLMPSPKNETITTNLKKTVSELKKGRVTFKNDDTSNVHQAIGKVSFNDSQLADNYQAFIEALRKAKPSAAKGTYLKSVTIASSMGPGVKVEL